MQREGPPLAAGAGGQAGSVHERDMWNRSQALEQALGVRRRMLARRDGVDAALQAHAG